MTDRLPPPDSPINSPTLIIGTILAMGVIRLLEREERLDNLSEQRVSTGVVTTEENTRE